LLFFLRLGAIRYKFCFVAFILFACNLTSSAQKYGTTRYTTEDGLASSNASGSILEATDGKLWIAHYPAAVSSFDGKNFKRFNQFLGILNVLIEDGKGRIWVGTTAGQYYIKNDSIYTVGLTLPDSLKISYGSALFFRNNKTEVWLVTKRGFCKFDETSQKFVLQVPYLINGSFVSANSWIDITTMQECTAVLQLSNDKLSIPQLLIFDGKEIDSLPMPLYTKGNFVFRNQFYLLTPNPAFKIYRLEHDRKKWRWVHIASFPKFTDDNIVISINGDTLMVVDSKMRTDRKLIYLQGPDFKILGEQPFEYFGYVNIDKAGNEWIGTESGLFRRDTRFFNTYARDNPKMLNQIYAINEDQAGQIYMGSYLGGVSKWDGKNVTSPSAMAGLRFLSGTAKNAKGDLLFFLEDNSKNMVEITEPDSYRVINTPQALGFYLDKNRAGQLLWCTEGLGLLVQKKAKGCIEKHCWDTIGVKKGLLLENVLTVVEDTKGRYWMGRTSQGIAVYEPIQDTVFNYLRTDSTGLGCISSQVDTHGGLWFGCHKGLYYYPTPDKVDPNLDPEKDFRQIGNDFLIENAMVTSMTIVDNRLVIGTSEGQIGIIDLDAFYRTNQQEVRIIVLDKTNGYDGGSIEQNAFYTDTLNRVWMGNLEGATRLDVMAFDFDTTALTIQIDSLIGSWSSFYSLNNGQSFRFSNAEPDIKVYLKAAGRQYWQDQVLFSYCLGRDSVFSRPSRSGLLQFTRLPVGRHRLQVRAYLHGVVRGTYEIEIVIPQVWYLSWWFLTLVGLTLIGLYWLKRSQNEKFTALTREKNLFQVQSIANQLNPHYIRNALNWIGNRHYKDQEAAHMIDRLADHVTTIFKNTRDRKAHHTIGEELNLSSSYLTVQSYRYGAQNLQVILPSQDDIDKVIPYHIPVTLIQQHCENASEHGIKGVGGYIKIALECENPEYVIIHIEDNGRGRKEAASIEKSTTGLGLKMMQNLIDLYNRGNRLHITQYFTDDIIQRADGTLHGTRVTIQLPKIYHYDQR
jgi:ligand-binding sensor domain-containing protein/signal transduction histidine kinase